MERSRRDQAEPHRTRAKSKNPTHAPSAAAGLIAYEDKAFSEEELHAWSYFLKAYKVATEGVDKSLRENSALSLAEFEMLHKVALTGGRIRFIDLARITLLSQSRVSRQIDALQAKGFLRREITASDNRATFAAITTEGQRALEAALEPFAQAYRRYFLDIIPKGRLSSFSGVLRLLMQNEDYVAVYRETIERARANNGLKSHKQD
jgi:DNA-binding MarR family transcriptional regulator